MPIPDTQRSRMRQGSSWFTTPDMGFVFTSETLTGRTGLHGAAELTKPEECHVG